MKAAVFDTYVPKKPQGLMHFDIIVPEGTPFEKVQKYGQSYLKTKGQEDQPLTSKECRFCHIEEAAPELENSIVEKGYYILEMQGCE